MHYVVQKNSPVWGVGASSAGKDFNMRFPFERVSALIAIGCKLMVWDSNAQLSDHIGGTLHCSGRG